MSDYGSPDPEHTAALAAVDEARQEALRAVGEMRQFGPPPHHPNLAPADGAEKTLASMCTQKVVDYLLQLRPYRTSSQNWGVTLGTLELPTRLDTGSSNRRGGGQKRDLWLCRQPEIPLNDVSHVIEAANMSVQYSTCRQTRPTTSPAKKTPKPILKTGTEEYGRLKFDDQESLLSVAFGSKSVEAAIKQGVARPAPDNEPDESQSDNDSYTPAVPVSNNKSGLKRGVSHNTKSFNIVFESQTLLTLVEIADEVAAEIDLLIELDAPDFESGGQGAV